MPRRGQICIVAEALQLFAELPVFAELPAFAPWRSCFGLVQTRGLEFHFIAHVWTGRVLQEFCNALQGEV